MVFFVAVSTDFWGKYAPSVLLAMVALWSVIGMTATSSTQRRPARGVVAAILQAATLFALVSAGYLFSPFWKFLATGIFAVSLLTAAVSLLTPNDKQQAAFVSAMLAIPVSAVALSQAFFPSVAPLSIASSCENVPVSGSALTIRTSAAGNVIRSGPGTEYEPRGRLDIGCLVGVDGYCVGEPILDSGVPIEDVRWLRIRFTDTYIAAGPTFFLGADSSLGVRPDASCPSDSNRNPAVGADIEVIPDPEVAGGFVLAAAADRGTVIGFSFGYVGAASFDATQVEHAPKSEADDGRIYVRVNPSDYAPAGPTTRLLIAGVPCLGAIVPVAGADPGEIPLFEILPASGALTRSFVKPSADEFDRLRYAACRVDPRLSNEEIADATASVPPGELG